MKNIVIIMITITTISLNQALAQKKELSSPEIGKPLPNFTLNEVHYYKSKKISLNDLKGQYFILEFWDKFCGACVASFPQINRIQQQFKGKLQIVLVGNSSESGIFSSGEKIRDMYENYRVKENLRIAAAFDTTVVNRFVPYSDPHLIWVDRKGIVQAITADGLTQENVKSFIAGKTFSFIDHSLKAVQMREKYNNYKLLLVDGNGGNDTSFMFRSIFTKSNFSVTSKHVPFGISYPLTDTRYYKPVNGRVIFQFACAQPEYLIRCAFVGLSIFDLDVPELYGKVAYNFVFDIQDSLKLKKYKSMVYDSTYNYSLAIPEDRGSPVAIQRIMQSDLQNYFDLNVQVKDTLVSVWKLVIIDTIKVQQLKTKGDTPPVTDLQSKYQDPNRIDNSTRTSISFKNGSIGAIIRKLYRNFDTNLFDYTNLHYNIDIKMDAILNHQDEVIKALRANGFDIVKGERKMKAIVLSEPKSYNTSF